MSIAVAICAMVGAFMSGVALMYLVMMRTYKKRLAEGTLTAA